MNKETLKQELNLRGLNPSETQIDQLIDLMKTTLETNEKFNLTAIKDEETFLEKMIFDSALTLVDNDLTDKEVLDLGTGAGFPGLVLYILNPKIKLTLLDSTKKKIDYLADFCAKRGYKVNAVSARAEEFARNNREKYDYVTARAVSELSILMELAIPMIKVNGCLLALKAVGIENEINSAKGAFKALNCSMNKMYEDYLPVSKEYRAILSIKKDKVTISKYPRDYAIIKARKL
ncbi:MAG: 16S rRNA (guanine(527)-N(7))-methyltransferase RsmG [Bacilli bacterium]|nr:16S rRNA (guanine(527)-N(7))-methyltransferase RsmG [Bacilli bacterium]